MTFIPDIYANSARADDSGDGLSLATAKKTLSALQTLALSRGSGVKIGLVAGSVWREDLDLTSLADKWVQGVGDLAGAGLPLIDGSYINVATWQTSTDRADANTNVYSLDLDQTLAEGYISCWDDDVKPQWRFSVAAVQANAGSFYVSGTDVSTGKTSTGTRTLYFHPSDSSNPNSNGRTVRITDPTRYGALRLGAGTVRLVHTRCNMDANGSLTGSGLAEGVLASAGVKHEALFEFGTYRKCVGWHPDNDTRTNGIVLEFFATDGTGRACFFNSCIAKGPWPTGQNSGAGTNTEQVVVGMGGHNSGAGTYYTRCDWLDCSVSMCSNGFSGDIDAGDMTRVYVENCSNLSGVVWNATGGTLIDPYFKFTQTSFSAAIRVIQIENKALTIDGMRLYISGASVIDGVFFQPQNHVITGSVIVFESEDSFAFVWGVINAARTVAISSSIIEVRKNNLLLYQNSSGPLLGSNQNNVYYDGSSSGYLGAQKDNVLYNTMAGYLSAYPETGTITTNPGLIDPANGNFATSSPPANGAGLARPTASYTPIPASLAAAEAWIVANVSQ